VTIIAIAVLEVTVARVPPKRTEVVLRRSVPLIVTDVPPPASPEMGETEVTVAGAENVNAELAVTEPPAVVTTTLTAVALADLAGVVTVTDVSVRLTIDCAGVPPNVTPDVVERPTPEIVTD
jgi:hypothetical protein